MLKILSAILFVLLFPAVVFSAPLRPACSGGFTKVTVCESGCDYLSLALAEAGEDDEPDLTDECVLEFELGFITGGDGTSVLFGNEWITDAWSNRIWLHGKDSEVTTPYKWDTNRYWIIGAVPAVQTLTYFVEVSNLQVSSGSNDFSATLAIWSASGEKRIHNNFIRSTTNNPYGVDLYGGSAHNTLFYNNIVTGPYTGGCIRLIPYGTADMYIVAFNTFVSTGVGEGVYGSSGTLTIAKFINNICTGRDGLCEYGTSDRWACGPGSGYLAFPSTDAGLTWNSSVCRTGEVSSLTYTEIEDLFTDLGNYDLSLKPTSTILKAGLDMSTYPTVNITTDIAGTTRAATPTIGAYELAASGGGWKRPLMMNRGFNKLKPWEF